MSKENFSDRHTIIEDCKTLTATQLKEKYKGEYNAWRNMKRRQKDAGLPVHPQFEDIRSFLTTLGPKSDAEETLDRIDPSDPDYSPDKVRWAKKKQQSNNRSNTITFEHNGRVYSASELADLARAPISTIRARIKKGWTYEEIIHGRSTTRAKTTQRKNAKEWKQYLNEERWPWLGPKSSLEWEEQYREDQPEEARFEYFETIVRDELSELKKTIDLEYPLLVAKMAGRLHDPDIADLLEHNPHIDPTRISEQALKNKAKAKAAKIAVLEKLESFRNSKGEFHHRPNWEVEDD